MFFLSWRFSTFAQQAEHVSSLFLKNQQKPLPMQHVLIEYLKSRESVAAKLLHYENQTKTVNGWLGSFVPFTHAYAARKNIAAQLHTTNRLYLQIVVDYYKHIQEEQKLKNFSSQKRILKKVVLDDKQHTNKQFVVPNKNSSQETVASLLKMRR